ncbi:MAG: hypothetical protein ABFS46_11425 [Myxococcota bacterium]
MRQAWLILVLFAVAAGGPAGAAIFPGPDEFWYVGSQIEPTLRDVRTSGTQVPLGFNSLSAPVPIGFVFEFYGLEYSTFRVSANGFITLGSGFQSSGCCSGQPIPRTGSPNNLIAAWWSLFGTGNVRFQTVGAPGVRELVVGFYDVPHFPTGPTVTWEIVLHEGTHEIEIQCFTCPSDGRLHSIGIENLNGTIGLQVARSTSSLPRIGVLLARNDPPDCSAAAADPESLWPPNGAFVEAAVVGVVDPDGDPVEIAVDAVFQDEALDERHSPLRGADAWGIGSDRARLRAERSATGDGRVYHVEFTARDLLGGTCEGSVTVCVPQRRSGGCEDQGPEFDSSSPPSVLSSDPVAGAAGVPRTAWLRLSVEGLLPASRSVGIRCDGERVPSQASALGSGVLVLNPVSDLPAGSFCSVRWTGARGPEEFFFSTEADRGSGSVPYDRRDPSAVAPFPDDYWLVPDASTASGSRLEFDVGPLGAGLLDAIVNSIAAAISDRDGYSPAQSGIIALSEAVDEGNLPKDESATLDPFSPIALYDMEPGSPEFGKRVPFQMRMRSDRARDDTLDHSLVIFPARTLDPGGTYAFVVTRRLHAAGDPGRPFDGSEFFRAVAGPPTVGEAPEVARARESIEPVLAFLETTPALPIPREDVALALRISVRTESFDPSDLVAIKEDYLANPPPPIQIDSIRPGFGRAAFVEGTVELPFYLGPVGFGSVNRDPVSGRPVPVETEAVRFTLTLPFQAETGPVPIVFYEHGHPGSPDEVFFGFNEFLDDAGYAIAGIHDVLNRRFPGSDVEFIHLLGFQRLPLFDLQSYADMLGFLRAIEGLGTQSLLPVFAPDAIPEIDPARILFRGISYGSHYSLAFLPLAPEITAAASVVGAGRFFENTIHQVVIEDFLTLVPGARPGQILIGLAAVQNDSDRQDSYFMARHLYRERLEVAGLEGSLPPNLLWLEGIGDSLVSNTATRAAADELGIPLLRPVQRATPVLEEADAPLSENLGPDLTAAHFQYDPPATPSCRDLFGEFEGHFCPQIALEAEAQTLHFFSTALDPTQAAEIIDPFPMAAPLAIQQLDGAAKRFGPSSASELSPDGGVGDRQRE